MPISVMATMLGAKLSDSPAASLLPGGDPEGEESPEVCHTPLGGRPFTDEGGNAEGEVNIKGAQWKPSWGGANAQRKSGVLSQGEGQVLPRDRAPLSLVGLPAPEEVPGPQLFTHWVSALGAALGPDTPQRPEQGLGPSICGMSEGTLRCVTHRKAGWAGGWSL